MKHPKCPEWGIGRVAGQEADIVRVIFQQLGKKKIDVRYVNLELVEAPPYPENYGFKIHALAGVNLERPEALCSSFHQEMRDNRRSTNDGRMALNVLDDFRTKGELTHATQQQLFAWCLTEGSAYQRGVDMAQQICREIYGQVATRQEVNSL